MFNIYKKILNYFFNAIYGNVKLGTLKQILIENRKYKSFLNFKLYIIENGRIFTDCHTNVAYIKNNLIIPKISYQQNKDKISNINHNSVLKKGTPKFIKYFNGNIFSLVQGASGENYWHWIFDIIPKLEIMSENKLLHKFDYFYVPKRSKFVIETFKFFKINLNKIIISKDFKHIRGDKIYAMEHLYLKMGGFHNQFKNMPKWIPLILRKKFLKNKNKKSKKIKLFIDRSDSIYSRFNVINNDQFKNFLKLKKYKSYKLSKLNLNRQISLFKSSRSVLGPHGAGFANILFCNPGTKIFEILTNDSYQRPAIKTLCNHLNLIHCKIILPKKKSNKINFKDGIYIDPSFMEKKKFEIRI